MRWLIAESFRPLTRLLPRGTGHVLNLFGKDDAWRNHPRRQRTFFDRSLQSQVQVDLGEWFGRLHYFAGRYYDNDIPHLIRTELGPGDTFVDIGAHYGMHTLCAAQLVGPAGRVVAIEPNPRSFSILESHIRKNALGNVSLHNCGAGDREAVLALQWDDTNMASFLPGAGTSHTASVPVRRADDLLANEPTPGKMLIKIDTEGFEHRAIEGLRDTLARKNVALVVEMTDEWLRKAGSSAQALVDDLRQQGYTPHLVQTHFGWMAASVSVMPIETLPDTWQYDLLFKRS